MILLDTHAWVWWVSAPEKLSEHARTRIEEAAGSGEVFVSSISAWEVAMLVSKGRLDLTLEVDDWIARSEAVPYFHFLPVDNRIAVRSVNLPPPLHPDPADRIVAATALALGAEVVTRDRRLRDYPPLSTLW